MSDGEGIRVVGFAGSARAGSYNKQLVQVALAGAQAAGADVQYVDLRDFSLPLYEGDEEAEKGWPENLPGLRAVLEGADALLIASPEYNGFLSPLLKNTLDWLSRGADGNPELSIYHGQIAAIMAASPGPLGGLRGLRGVRELLTNLGVTVLPNQIAVRGASKAFSATGELIDEGQAARVAALGAELASFAMKLR